MKSTTPAPTANDNAVVTPALDATCAILCATLPPALAWALRGWAAHIRPARHAIHVANSWAKHREEFGTLLELAHAVTVARCVDAGVAVDDVPALLATRVEARAAKAAKTAA